MVEPEPAFAGWSHRKEGWMGLRLEDKQAIVTEVQAVAQTAHSVVAAEYRGLTVSQLTGLRAKARQAGVYMRVVKNTLARRAVTGTPYECIAGSIKGPLILAFSQEDPGAAARVVKEFAKGNEKLVPTLVALGGQVYPAREIDRVASLPTRAQALSMLLGVLKAPVTKFVRTLAEPAAKLVRTVDAIKAVKAA
jgi:large subunit ribosomal protein L10